MYIEGFWQQALLSAADSDGLHCRCSYTVHSLYTRKHNAVLSFVSKQPQGCLLRHEHHSHMLLEQFDNWWCGFIAGFVVVSALPNDSRYVSPASTRAASPMGSRGGSFTAQEAPTKSSQSDQSAQSTGAPADTADSSPGDAASVHCVRHMHKLLFASHLA